MKAWIWLLKKYKDRNAGHMTDLNVKAIILVILIP